MPRLILIDRHTGYVFGDTADFAAGRGELTPVEAARLLDESNQDHGYAYAETPRGDARATYDVYRADIGGSEAVGVVTDGQDRETIEAVERDCLYETSVARTRDPV